MVTSPLTSRAGRSPPVNGMYLRMVRPSSRARSDHGSSRRGSSHHGRCFRSPSCTASTYPQPVLCTVLIECPRAGPTRTLLAESTGSGPTVRTASTSARRRSLPVPISSAGSALPQLRPRSGRRTPGRPVHLAARRGGGVRRRWKTLDSGDPGVVESGLIAEFRNHYGRRPLGNLKD
jgi:hypothetical protein